MPLLQTVHYEGSEFTLLDLQAVHPTGNKYFKLKGNIEKAKRDGYSTILSFGGAWSNHIHALALAGREHGLNTIGVIRGERPPELSAMLQDAESLGMQLHFVSRTQYRSRDEQAFQQQLVAEFGDFLLVPEGGSNFEGVSGAAGIVPLLSEVEFDHLVLPVGTGGTLSGIVSALPADKQVLGICVLKGADYLDAVIERWAPGRSNWLLDHAGHEGGYARVSARLKAFIEDFESATRISLDPVYTGKMLLRLVDMLKAGEIGGQVVVVHTGGLQGRRGFNF